MLIEPVPSLVIRVVAPPCSVAPAIDARQLVAEAAAAGVATAARRARSAVTTSAARRTGERADGERRRQALKGNPGSRSAVPLQPLSGLTCPSRVGPGLGAGDH